MQDACSPFSPCLEEDVLMGNLVWENSDKWPVCGEGIRKKGREEKWEDNGEGMFFLEEGFKEEADHVTAMGNTICILHKNRGKQLWVTSLHDTTSLEQRGSEGQGSCVSWTVTSLLLLLWFDLLRTLSHIPGTTTPHSTAYHKMAFFPPPSWTKGINPTLRLHSMQAAPLHSSSSQGRAWVLPAQRAPWPGMAPALR